MVPRTVFRGDKAESVEHVVNTNAPAKTRRTRRTALQRGLGRITIWVVSVW
jgi:hypothetical protein